MIHLILSLIITEVMANPLGKTGAGYPEDRNEFIEIFNDTDDTIDMSEYTLYDFDKEDEIYPWDDSTILELLPGVIIGTTRLPPHTYGVILDREYGSDGKGGNENPYSIPEGVIILTLDDTSIGDGLTMNDSVILFNEKDTAEFFYPRRTRDGYSVERVEMDHDPREYWEESLVMNGTPGRRNSVSDFVDLSISYLNMEPSLAQGDDTVLLDFGVVNRGYAPVYTWNYEVHLDDSMVYRGEGDTLYRDEESYFKYKLGVLKPGNHTLRLSLSVDGDDSLYNNEATKTYRVYSTGRCIGYEEMGEDIRINFNFPFEEGKVRIYILNLRGFKVKEFQSPNPAGYIEFNPQDLKRGRYVIVGRCKDMKSKTILYIR